jgi:hypothetical protein
VVSGWTLQGEKERERELACMRVKSRHLRVFCASEIGSRRAFAAYILTCALMVTM